MIFFKSLLPAGAGLILFFTASAHDVSLQERAANRLAPMLQIVNIPFSEEDLKNPQNRTIVISNLSERRWLRSLRPRSPAQKQAITAKLIEVFLFDPNEKVSLDAKRTFLSINLKEAPDLYGKDYFHSISKTLMSALSETDETVRLRAVKLLFSLPSFFKRKITFLKVMEKALADPDPQIRTEAIRRLDSNIDFEVIDLDKRVVSFYFALQIQLADIALTDPDPKARETAEKKLDIAFPPVLLKLMTALDQKTESDQRQRAADILRTSEVRLGKMIIGTATRSLFDAPHNIQLTVIQILGEKQALLQETVYMQIMEGRAFSALSLEEKNTAFKSWEKDIKSFENNRSLQRRLTEMALHTLNPSSRSMIIKMINLNLPIVWKIIDQALSDPPQQNVQTTAIQIFKERGNSLPKKAWTKFDFMRKLKMASNEEDFPFQQEKDTENIEPASSQRESDPAPSKLYALFSFLQVPSTKCKKAILSKTE